MTASFVYDADGNRVQGTVNGTTTVYIAGLYEYQGGATTLYYEGNALRRTGYAADNGVFYLLQDQLKSSSVLANQNGTVNSRNYFYPFGGNRGGAAFSALTTKRFTGQYHEAGLPGGEGLSYYGARWYDAQLGRFASADSIVPSPNNPQAFNRYAYTLNNPLRYTDSTGHSVDGPGVGSYVYGGSSASNHVYLPLISFGGENPYSLSYYPYSQRGSRFFGQKPSPQDEYAPWPFSFINVGANSIFGDGKNYSSIDAKSEAHEIALTCWFLEQCGPRAYYGPYSALTQDIQAKEGVQRMRENWAAQGYSLPFQGSVPIDSRGSNAPLGMRVLTGGWAYVGENFYLGASTLGFGSTTPSGAVDPVGGVIGSFDIRIHDAGNGQVLFEALNTTGWASGTRIPGTGSSLIYDKDQSNWGPGGNFKEVFYWWEPKP